MELRHLRYFLAGARPTLSHQVKQVEQMVGIVLFEPNTKDVEFTAAGRLFKPYCECILKEIESSALAISELEGLIRGTLRMAVFHSSPHSMLPPIMSEPISTWPSRKSPATTTRSSPTGCLTITMTISLAFLVPDLVKAAIERRLPYGMGVTRLCELPPEWSR
jgi:DNA-binding transcriptional LysR family regulator